MRVLALGSTGRVGRLVRAAWPHEAGLTPIWHGRGPNCDVSFDITEEPDALSRAIADADAVLCLAGTTLVSDAPLDVNVAIAQALGRCCARPLLILSSAAVYGRMSGPLSEAVSPVPASSYGDAKLEAEREIHNSLPHASCLRLGNLLGADALLGAGQSQFTLDQFPSDGYPRRSYIGPQLLARVLCSLLTQTSLPPVLNIATPQPVSMAELLDAAGLSYATRPAPSTAIETVAIDTTQLQRLFRFPPDASNAQTLVQDWLGVTQGAP